MRRFRFDTLAFLILIAVSSFCNEALAQTAKHEPSVLQLKPGVPIILDSSEDPAIQAAVADLRRDLRKVLGADSPILSDQDKAGRSLALVITSTRSEPGKYRNKTLTAPESYSLSIVQGEGPRVVLQGADTRGTIYAIYEFSDRVLGVPPLWFWSGWEPKQQNSLPVDAAMLRRVAAPAVRWRGWFPNDTDMLDPWITASSAHMDLFLETLLRLRFNLLDVDHISDWNGQPNLGLQLARRCKARGIEVTFTHLAPFGLVMGDWGKYWTTVRHVTPPPLLLSNLSALDEYWRYAIQLVQSEHLDVIQSIEFRWDGDRPFWRGFADAPKSDADRAQVISEMLSHQLKLLKDVTGNAAPLAHTVFYDEVGGYMAAGLLHPPNDPRLIWTFSSEQRDHFPRPEVLHYQAGDRNIGYYLNLQFFTTGSHVVEGEGPWKIYQNLQQLRDVAGPGRFELLILNVGNLREFTPEVAVSADMLWNSTETADDALRSFCGRYFGTSNSERVFELYRDYYNAYWQQKKPNIPGFDRQYIFQDLRYARAAEAMLARIESRQYSENFLSSQGNMFEIVPEDSGSKDDAHAILEGTREAASRMKTVVNRLPVVENQIPAADQPYFVDALSSDAYFMLAANQFLHDVTQAYIEMSNKEAASRDLADAEGYLQSMEEALASRQQGEFAGWYGNETKFNLRGLDERLKRAEHSLGP